jgi:hypothetical protein
MTRPEQDTCAPSPPRRVVIEEQAEPRDSLFERWLARSPSSQPRLRAAKLGLRSAPPPEPIGDGLADAWFR